MCNETLAYSLHFSSGMERQHRILSLAAGLAMALGAYPAHSLSLLGIAVEAGPANTANEFVDTGANRTQIGSSAGLVGAAPGPVADVEGAQVGFEARFASLLAADRAARGGSLDLAATFSYTITFTVDNPLAGPYRLDIDARRIGALTLVDDGNGGAMASLGAISAVLDGASATELALGAVGPLSGDGGGNLAFDQTSSTLSLFDSAATRTFTLAFEWTASVTSSQDEAAVRMGLPGQLSDTTADDYPGVGGRNAADDGHFVQVGVTMLAIPEPGTLLLVALGLLPLACRRVSKRE